MGFTCKKSQRVKPIIFHNKTRQHSTSMENITDCVTVVFAVPVQWSGSRGDQVFCVSCMTVAAQQGAGYPEPNIVDKVSVDSKYSVLREMCVMSYLDLLTMTSHFCISSPSILAK